MSISPHTEQFIASVPDGTAADIDRAVEAARRAFDDGEWPRTAVEERIATVERLATPTRRRPEIAEVISAENGCPITLSSHPQAGGPLAIIELLDDREEVRLGESAVRIFVRSVTVRREPVGVVAAIVPWNVPPILTMSKLAPALLAGCTSCSNRPRRPRWTRTFSPRRSKRRACPPACSTWCRRAHSESTSSASARRQGRVHRFHRGGADHRRICGEQLKRCSLELGGKSATIVLDDADLTWSPRV